VEETEDVSQKLEYLEYAEKLYIAILRKWRDNHRNNQREIGKKIRSIKSIRKELGGQNE
jgi:hypothetical protein